MSAIFKMAAKTRYKKRAVKIQHCPISSKFDMWVDNNVPTLNNFYRSPFSKWSPQFRTNSTMSDFNAISYVGRLWCPELIPDIEKFLLVAIFKMATTIPHKFNIVRFQRHFICGYIMMSRIDSWHRKISTGRHFQNGHHNTAQIQHCSISTSWTDSRHRKISPGLHFQNGHHNTAKIQYCSISKVVFNLFFKPVVSGRFGRLHNR